jgi:hypothetical protein
MRRTACRAGPPGGRARETLHQVVVAGPARVNAGDSSVPSDRTEVRGAVCLTLVTKVEIAPSKWQLPMANICLASRLAIPSWVGIPS